MHGARFLFLHRVLLLHAFMNEIENIPRFKLEKIETKFNDVNNTFIINVYFHLLVPL